MKKDELLQSLPREGFVKVGSQKVTTLSDEQRTALIRKGNEFFNAGRFDDAKRIFLTTGYSDGIIRMGDYYFNKSEPLEALRMYWLAPAPDKKEMLVEKMATVLQRWIKEKRSPEG